MSPLERPTGFSTPDHLRTMRRRRLRVTGGAALMLAFGLLLWARFILVTGHPRTAVADPPPQADVPAAAHTAAPADPTDEHAAAE